MSILMPFATERATRAAIALAPAEVEQFFPGELAIRLRALLPGASWCDPLTVPADEWRAIAATSSIVVTSWRAAPLPDPAPALRYVCHVTGSLRGVLPRTLLARGVRATNWGAIAAPLVAEHALLLALALLRGLPRWGPYVTASVPPDAHDHPLPTRSLRGRRVAIHGFGQIARELVKLLHPFGCDVAAYSPGVPDEFYVRHGARPARDLASLAAGADVFITCEALTDRTRGTIDRFVLAALPRGAVFVNVGRGAVVDEAALATVAIERRLRVGSDVFVAEPLPHDSPLLDVPDAIYSPHVAGPTSDWFPRCGAAALENIRRFLAGESLLNEVTLELYDRAT